MADSQATAAAPVQSTDGHVSTVTIGDTTVSSNADSEDQIKAALDPEGEQDDDDTKRAASALGKRGGKASAEKRAQEEKEARKAEKKQKAEAADEGGDDEPDDDDDGDAAAKAKRRDDPRHNPIARMKQATKQAAEAKRELAEERARREALEARIARLESGAPPASASPRQPGNGRPAPDANAEPQEEDFEHYREYVKAQAKWAARQEITEVQRKQQEARQAEQHGKAVKEVIDRMLQETDALQKESPDAYEAVAEVASQFVPTFGLPPGVRFSAQNFAADEMLTSKSGAPRIMLYLSEHPDALQRLATLTDPRDAIREVARIDARLDAANPGPPASQAKPVSKAPPPIRPVTGAPPAAGPKNLEDMSFDEYARYKDAERIRLQKQARGL
jgi:hypothetical protein